MRNLTVAILTEYLTNLDEETWIQENRLYIKGDHWQEGKQWVGPMIDVQDDPHMYQVLRKGIEKEFSPQNVIKETSGRVIDALLGRPSTWKIVPKSVQNVKEYQAEGQEKKEIDLLDAMFIEWYDKREVHQKFREFLKDGLVSQEAIFRYFIPRSSIDEETGEFELEFVEGTREVDINKLALKLYLDVPKREDAEVYVDSSTMDELGIYRYFKKKNELKDEETEYVETVFIDELEDGTKETVLLLLTSEPTPEELAEAPDNPEYYNEKDETEVIAEMRMNLGGRITMYKRDIPVLVTEPVKRLQNQLNKTLTMLGHNLNEAGFLQEIFLNAQMPGHFEEEDIGNGRKIKRFVPDPIKRGSGYALFLQGLEQQKEADGTKSYTTPSVYTRQPVDVSTFEKGEYVYYRSILREVRQLHALITGDAAPSGESRKQALHDFAISLYEYSVHIERAGRWLFETLLAMIEHFAGEPGKYTNKYRIEFTPVIDPGPMSAEDKKFVLDAIAQGVWTLEDGRIKLGDNDPQATEAQAIKEKEARAKIQQETIAQTARNFNAGNRNIPVEDNQE